VVVVVLLVVVLGTGAGAGAGAGRCKGGGVRHRRATEWARAATAPGGPDAVTALNAWSSDGLGRKGPTASSQPPLWLLLPHALHRGGRIDRALDAFTGRHQTTQPFPLGTDFWE
jgi:hypothetical protein